jgi:hypothetical protein
VFGDDALKLSVSASFEQGGTIAIEFIAELNPAIGIASN